MAKTDKHIEDNIKTFLKVRIPKAIDKQYYSISDNRQIFTLNSEKIEEGNKTVQFEIDKIFTDENENSYIFEEIGRDCISECLQGKHFTYISYGSSSSDKYQTIFGEKNCSTNIANRGIFPRLLEQLLTKITSDKELNQNLSVNLSYFLMSGMKLIDLSKLMGRDLSNVTEAELMQSGIEIKQSPEIVSQIKKIPTENPNEVIFFLSKVFDLFYKLEVDSCHLLTWSHFFFVIYITNNSGKLISTLTFLLLAGSENLQTKVTNPNAMIKDSIKNTKATLEKEASFLSLIRGITNLRTKQKLPITEETKISIVLSKLCFNPNYNMEFRIIGNVLPNTGQHEIVNNTLVFLFQCKKIVRMIPDTRLESQVKKEEVRDDVVYDLEIKLAAQLKKMQKLTEKIDKKQNKIVVLETNYKAQIEALKSMFNFKGDVNALLSGGEYTKEARYAREIREAMESNRIKANKILELEQKIESLKEERKKMKTAQEVKDNDKTMIALYTKFVEDKASAESNLKITNEHLGEIEEMKTKNKTLEKLISEYKKELDVKTNVLNNLPQVLQNKPLDRDPQKIKAEIKKKVESKYQKEAEEIERNNLQEEKIFNEKHANLLKQKEHELEYLKQVYEKLKKTSEVKGKAYIDEMIAMTKLIENMIKEYRKCFDKKKFPNGNCNSIDNFQQLINLKEKFDNTITSTEKCLNHSQFPLLYQFLLTRGPYDTSKVLNDVLIPNKAKENEETSKPKKEIKSGTLTEKSISEIEKAKEACFSVIEMKSAEEVGKMDKESLEFYAKKLTRQLKEVKSFTEIYMSDCKGYSPKDFAATEEYVEKLHKTIDKLKQQYVDQVAINNNNQIVLRSHQKRMGELTSENFMLQNSLYLKEVNDKVSFPIFASPRLSSRPTQQAIPPIEQTKQASVSKPNDLSKGLTPPTSIKNTTAPSMPTVPTLSTSMGNRSSRPMTAQNFNKRKVIH